MVSTYETADYTENSDKLKNWNGLIILCVFRIYPKLTTHWFKDNVHKL